MRKLLAFAVACAMAVVGFGEIVQEGATQAGEDGVYTWTENGSVTIPDGGQLVDLLLVGGGGGGGANNGGGGGGGGVVEPMKVNLSAGIYTIEIGQGGNGSTSGVGANGGDTVIRNASGEIVYIAHGGGGGGPGEKSSTPGKDGASGGGSTLQASTKAGGQSIYAGEGFAGGYVVKADTDDICSGGGGGAGGPGENAYALVQRKAAGNGHSGHGGPGRLSQITGQYYGGGGGAGVYHDANDAWGGEVRALSGMGGKGGGGHGVRLTSGNVDERDLENIQWYKGQYNYTDDDFQTKYEVGDGVSDRFDGVNGLGGGGGGAGRGTGGSVVGNGGSGVVVMRIVSVEDPVVSLAVTSVGYTSGMVSVNVAALGSGAANATAKVLISTSDDMSGAREITLDPKFTGPEVRSVEIDGLVTNTTYYICASLENDKGVSGSSDVESFLTLTPTAAAGSFLLKSNASTSQTFLAMVTDLGDDSHSAVITMQCATDEDFTEGLCESDPLDIGETDLNVEKELSVLGLQKDTPYYSRLKIVNAWGLIYYAKAFFCPTFDSLVVQGIGYTAVEGGFNVDVVVSYMDGNSATVELFANGVSLGTQELTAAGSASFVVSSAADLTALRAVVTGVVTVEKTVSAKKGTSAVIVGKTAEHASAATAVKVRAGDSISLPPLAGKASYKILNHSFLSLDGTTLTAIKPGIVGVECYNESGVYATTMAVLVLPEKIGNGNIYIWNEKGSGGENWCSSASWMNADGSAATDFPKNEDDIAIIPHYDVGGKWLKLSQNISLGGLYAGRFNSVNADAGVHINRSASPTPTLTFKRSDGKPVMIQICGNAVGYERRYMVYFADSNDKVNFTYASDTIVDGGWDGIDSMYAGGRPSYAANCTNEVPAGVTLSWRNIDSRGGDRAETFTPPLLVGGGTVWNRSAAKIWYKDRNYNGFTGVLRDSGYGSEGAWLSMPMRLVTGTISNTAVEVYGFVGNNGGSPSVDLTKAAGLLSTGGDHPSVAPAKHSESWFPKKGLTMVNGAYQCNQVESPGWGAGLAELKRTDNFTIGQGFSAVIPQGDLRDTSYGHPINWFETANLTHLNKGTLRFDDLERKHQGNATMNARKHSKTILHGASAYVSGDIIPWMVATSKTTDGGHIAFARVNEDDVLYDLAYAAKGMDSITDPTEDVYAWSTKLTVTESKTMNSLLYCANGNPTTMGAGKTLTITSGGLILSYKNSKHSSIGSQSGGEANGALVLGDETHPGYVFSCSTGASAPCGIWAPTTAQGGLVFGYTGYALLAGDQTGVDDELVVNAGTLDLGSQDKTVACMLDVPVRILANATVKMNNVSMAKSDVYFDDIAGYTGKIQLNANSTCQKLYVRDTPEETEWTSLPRGTYGATGSGATNIDDLHFAGTGVLTVRKDDLANGLMLFVK